MDAEEIDFSNAVLPEVTRMYLYGSTSSSSGTKNFLKTIKVNDMYIPKLTNLSSCFAYYPILTKVETANFNTDNVTNMSSCFASDKMLTSEGLDFSS